MFFEGAQNTTIDGTPSFTSIGGDQNNYHGAAVYVNNVHNGWRPIVPSNGERGIARLRDASTAYASYDSMARDPPPRCHPGTRTTLLRNIAAWHAAARNGTTWDEIAEDGRPGSLGQHPARILWLHGPAGAGKSTIAQTVAEKCANDGTLAASFFFEHGKRGRDKADRLFPTIAYQVAVRGLDSRDVRASVGRAVENDASVFEKSFRAQVQTLLLKPLRAASTSPNGNTQVEAFLVVIDGLDECTGRSDQEDATSSAVKTKVTRSSQDVQQDILSCIMNLFDARPGYAEIPLCFLIVSRPEPHIRAIFEQQPRQAYHPLALYRTQQADRDVETFLRSEFHRIRMSYKHSHYVIPKTWPTESDLGLLLKRSGGYFIYPATILKFVDEEFYSPEGRLRTVVDKDSTGTDAFMDLDILYQRILTESLPRPLKIDDLLRILGYIFVQPPPTNRKIELTPRVIASVLNLSVETVVAILRRLHSILRVGGPNPNLRIEATSQDSPIECLHVSFADFLFDPSRAGRFYIDRKKNHSDITCGCLDLLRKSVATHSSIPPPGFEQVFHHFCFKSWTLHFGQVGDTAQLVRVLRSMDKALWDRINKRWTNEDQGLGSWWECIDMLDEASYESNIRLPQSASNVYGMFCTLRNVLYREHLENLSRQHLSGWASVIQHIAVLFDVSCFLLTLHDDGALSRLLGIGWSSQSAITSSGWWDIRKYATHIHRQIQRPTGYQVQFGLKEVMNSRGHWAPSSRLYPDSAARHAHLADRCIITLLPFKIVPENVSRKECFYAMKHWADHLANSTPGDERVLTHLRNPAVMKAVRYSTSFDNFVLEIETSQNLSPDSVIEWDSTSALRRNRFMLKATSRKEYEFHLAKSTSGLRAMFSMVDAANAGTVVTWLEETLRMRYPPSEEILDLLTRWKGIPDQAQDTKGVPMASWEGALSVPGGGIDASAGDAHGVRTDGPRRRAHHGRGPL